MRDHRARAPPKTTKLLCVVFLHYDIRVTARVFDRALFHSAATVSFYLACCEAFLLFRFLLQLILCEKRGSVWGAWVDLLGRHHTHAPPPGRGGQDAESGLGRV